jgi:hypothetical protein
LSLDTDLLPFPATQGPGNVRGLLFDGRFADVRVGSKADPTALKWDFRFTPESRHQADIARGPFRANSGSDEPYSITPSASHFRSAPMNGHRQTAPACRKSAKSRRDQTHARVHLSRPDLDLVGRLPQSKIAEVNLSKILTTAARSRWVCSAVSAKTDQYWPANCRSKINAGCHHRSFNRHINGD